MAEATEDKRLKSPTPAETPTGTQEVSDLFGGTDRIAQLLSQTRARFKLPKEIEERVKAIDEQIAVQADLIQQIEGIEVSLDPFKKKLRRRLDLLFGGRAEEALEARMKTRLVGRVAPNLINLLQERRLLTQPAAGDEQIIKQIIDRQFEGLDQQQRQQFVDSLEAKGIKTKAGPAAAWVFTGDNRFDFFLTPEDQDFASRANAALNFGIKATPEAISIAEESGLLTGPQAAIAREAPKEGILRTKIPGLRPEEQRSFSGDTAVNDLLAAFNDERMITFREVIGTQLRETTRTDILMSTTERKGAVIREDIFDHPREWINAGLATLPKFTGLERIILGFDSELNEAFQRQQGVTVPTFSEDIEAELRKRRAGATQ